MEYPREFVDDNRLLADLVRGGDPATPVPTCPGWTIRKLAAHVARGDRWAATIVRERSSGPVDPRTVADGVQPDDRDAEHDWITGGAAALIEAVEVDPEAPVWTFLGPRPAAWWVRRRLHESTVHRGDAALALGVPYEISPERAADGVSEWFDLVAARTGDERPLAPGGTLHLHATDDGLGAAGEWLLRGLGRDAATGVEWSPGHAKADAAVRGRAADLLLAVLRRSEDVEVLGDRAVWTTWLERTSF